MVQFLTDLGLKLLETGIEGGLDPQYGPAESEQLGYDADGAVGDLTFLVNQEKAHRCDEHACRKARDGDGSLKAGQFYVLLLGHSISH